jgi:hypothetical protein
MRFRPSADILRRLRFDAPGSSEETAAGCDLPADDPTRARSLAAWAFNSASRSRVCAISRSIPPSAQPMNSADFIRTWSLFRGRPRGIGSPFGGGSII